MGRNVREAARPIGLLVMAYGTATGPDDVERYYTDIRGGRQPSPELLEDLRRRYAAIGNRFPLLEITRRQARALEAELNDVGGGPFRAYMGMKHSPPFVAEAVADMRRDGIERAVGLVMAPHWSGMSVETYVDRVEKAVAEEGRPSFTYIRQWHDHPRFVDFLAARVATALERLDASERSEAEIVFTAHSLPTRTGPDGGRRCLTCDLCADGCRYVVQLGQTAELVAARLGLPRASIAWQSAGHTGEPWWGPPIREAIPRLAAEGRSAVVVCSSGFAADHLEVLYDLDVEAKEVADRVGIRLVRTEMPNDDPEFVRALAEIVRAHLADASGG